MAETPDPFDDNDNDDMVVQSGGPSETIVEFGEVTPDETNALYETNETGIWTDYYVVNYYETDMHRYMMGVTSPSGFNGASVAFVQLAAETLLLVCDWTGEKTGEPPAIPTSESANDNMILLDKHIESGMKELGAGGAEEDIIYRISGTYVYGFKNPTEATMCFPQPPWMQAGAGECEIGTDLEEDNIMCCESGGGGDEGETAPGEPGGDEDNEQD